MNKYKVGVGLVVISLVIGYYVWHQILPIGKKQDRFDYTIVFPDRKVNRIDISILSSDWQKIETQLTTQFGEKGKEEMMPMGNPQDKGFPPPMSHNGFKHDSAHSLKRPPMGMPPGPLVGSNGPGSNKEKELYIPCTISFEGKIWNEVGFRVKGNSSLMHSWRSGIEKYPFRLKFNAFKDSIPSTAEQRFFGFNKLSFSNGIKDPTLMREKLAADLFREAGVPAAHAAFYRVYINRGKGPEYFGLYTALEVVEDALLSNHFGNSDGNCYKPEGPGATFAKGTFNIESFEKKNNQGKKDWSDVEHLTQILNDTIRVTNPQQWQAQLEQVFDVKGFIKWLAVNSVIQNWDTYGGMFHNFYLYHHPTTGLLSWIPWDNNEALNGGGMLPSSSLSHKDVDENWPLIRYLLDNASYRRLYDREVENFNKLHFSPRLLINRIQETKSMILPFVKGEQGEVKGFTFLRTDNDFLLGIEALIAHIKARSEASKQYLDERIVNELNIQSLELTQTE